MGAFAPEDIVRHYQSSHDRLAALLGPLSEAESRTRVPCLPGWTVHDVLAHLAANTTDGLAGRIHGIPDDEFTSAQVRERESRSLDELFAEWDANLPTLRDVAEAGLAPPNLAVDAVTHEQDIREALGATDVDDADAVRFCLDLFGMGIAHKMKDAPVRLHVRATDSDYALDAGSGGSETTLRASELELCRVFAGRRTRAQVLALDWDGDGSACLRWLNMFGRVPEDAPA